MNDDFLEDSFVSSPAFQCTVCKLFFPAHAEMTHCQDFCLCNSCRLHGLLWAAQQAHAQEAAEKALPPYPELKKWADQNLPAPTWYEE